MRSYLQQLTAPRIVLWSYLIWYLVVLVRHFDGSFSLWANALGISAIMGTAYYLSNYAGPCQQRFDRWQVFRMYLMPFCVSSFAALIKGHGFILIFHPTWHGNLLALALIGGFGALVLAAKRLGEAAPAGGGALQSAAALRRDERPPRRADAGARAA